MTEYGFTENEDYMTMDKNVLRADGTPMPQIQHDHQLTIGMAKEFAPYHQYINYRESYLTLLLF